MTTFSSESLAPLSEWIEARLAHDGTPGLSLAVTDRAGIVHTAAYGLAEVASKTPMTTAHLGEIGSIGKSFTAIALLQLAEEGRIDLHAPVTEYLPWFSIRSAFEPIRLHHLLSHTAGITSAMDFAPAARIQVWGLRDAVATTPPGTYFHYSNIGYKVLGEVLQAVTGETYGPTLQARILDPLGLTDSFPTITTSIRDRLATGHSPKFDDRPWWPGRPLAPATWLETDTADGSLAMTAADLATYLRMLLNQGLHDGTRILSERGFDLLTQRVIAMGEDLAAYWYGYGVWTTVEEGRAQIGHGGGMVGYFSGMTGDLDLGIGVTTLVNGPGAPGLIARTVLAYFRSQAEGAPFYFPEIADRSVVANAGDYLGEYVAVEGGDGNAGILIEARENGLALTAGGKATPLRRDPWSADVFYTDDPALGRFPFVFERDGNEGPVTGIVHGGSVYLAAGLPAPAPVGSPAEWNVFTGHYRSHNPWTSSFRVTMRRGRLWLSTPSEPDGLEADQPLVPLPDGSFRCGDDPRIPEWIRFDVEIEGKTQRISISGTEFYRVNQE